MTFIDFIKSKLIGQKSVEISGKTFDEYLERTEAYSKFHLTELALFTVIDLIARVISKCEFVTVERGREVQKSEYFLWNYRPNRHQTKTEFLVQLFSRLIFRNEVMIFETLDGQLLIADSFARQERAVLDDIFTGVTARGYSFDRTFYESDVIYLRYNNVSVQNLITEMCGAYQELMDTAQEKYEKDAGHKVILGIDAARTNTDEFQENLRELMEVRFKNFFSKKNAVLPLYKGFSYDEPTTDAKRKGDSEVNDLQKLRAEAVASVANAFHVPPAVITGEASMLSEATEALIGNAVDPTTKMLAQEITVKRYGEADFLNGSYLMIDTTYARHIDPINSAANIDKAIACGTLNPYKAQKYCNVLPCDEDWAKEYYITKNYQNAAIALKGGEE